MGNSRSGVFAGRTTAIGGAWYLKQFSADTFSAIGRALRSLAVHSPAAFADALADALPWIVFLPAADRRLFLDEFSRVVLACTALDNYEALSQLVREEVACDCGGPRRLEACATAPARRRGDRRARLRS